MTKQFFILAIFMLMALTFSSINLIAQNGYDDFALKGNVHTMILTTSYSTDSLVFNRAGKVTEVWAIAHHISGWELTVTMTHDDNGNKIDYRTFYDSEPGEYYKFIYDDKNKLVAMQHFMSDTYLIGFVSYEYNDDGKVISDVYQNQDSSIYLVENYEYNKEGLLSKHTHQFGYTLYIYDSLARVSKETISTDGKTIDYIMIYTYNDLDQNIKWVSTNKRGKVLVTSTSTYDEMGNYIGGTYVSKDESIVFVYTYEYDEMGNWTKYLGATTTERKFTYYED